LALFLHGSVHLLAYGSVHHCSSDAFTSFFNLFREVG
jgi:hypothetical protein